MAQKTDPILQLRAERDLERSQELVEKLAWNEALHPRDLIGRWVDAQGYGRTRLEAKHETFGEGRSDLVNSILGNAEDTYQKNTLPGKGKHRRYTKERKKLHRKIAEQFLDGHKRQAHPSALMLGGGPASGKSTALKTGKVAIPDDAVHLDQDEVKKLLPEYRKLAEVHDPYASDAVHREAADLYAAIEAEARRRKQNLILEGTADSGPRQLVNHAKELKHQGYAIDLMYATVPTAIAEERAKKRAEATGRAVPLQGLRAMHSNVSKRFEEVLQNINDFNSVVIWDVRSDPPTLVFRHQDGETAILDPQLYNEFREKASEDPGTAIQAPTFV